MEKSELRVTETPQDTPKCDENESLFGISNDELNKIFYTISEYVDMIDLKDKEISEALKEISKTEDLVKNYLKELTMLNSCRRKDLKVIFYDILNEKFNSFDKAKKVREIVKKEYEKLFEYSKSEDLKKDIKIFFENQKLDKNCSTNIEILNEVYVINKLRLLSNLLTELDTLSIPSFLIQQYKPFILQRIRRICKEMFDIEYYTYEISNKLEYDVLKSFFNKIIISNLSLFDEKFFALEHRTSLLKLLILVNLEYIQLNKFSYNVLLEKLRNYIISFKLYDEEEDIDKKEKEIKKFIEISMQNTHTKNEALIKEWLNNLEKDLYAEKYLFLILSYSILLNNLAQIKINDNKISLEFTEFICSSRERVFLMNLLRRFQNDFSNEITKNYNPIKVNFNIENFIFLSLTKSYSQNLFDEDFSKKIVLTENPIFNSIRSTKSIYLKKEFEVFTKNLKISRGIVDKVKSELSDFFMNLIIAENKEQKVDLDSLKIASYDHKFLSNHIYIFVSGFTSQGEDNEKAWEGFLMEYSNYVDCYFYDWESRSKGQMVLDVAKFIGQAAITYYLNKKDFIVLLSNLNRYRTNNNLFIKTRKSAKI